VFMRDASAQPGPLDVAGVNQPLKVSGLRYGPAHGVDWRQGAKVVDFYDAKADVEALMAPLALRFEAAEHPAMHPGRSAAVYLTNGTTPIGHVGELHPRHRQALDLPQAPMMFELDASAVQLRHMPSTASTPKFPGAERDLAFVLDNAVTHAQLMAAIHAAPLGELAGNLRQATLFDIYRPKPGGATPVGDIAAHEKSCAVRLQFQSDVATLTDAQLDLATQAVVAQVSSQLSGRLRQ
jgi:phenylalanyl-tRNA synthetase beta chain